jgi:hypothetical protein
MPPSWIGTKVMKYSREVCLHWNENDISTLEMILQVSYQSSKILLFGAIVERKNDEVRCDQKENEKELQSGELSESFKFGFNSLEGEINRNKEQGKKIDEVSGSKKMSNVKRFAKQIKGADGEKEKGHKDKGIPFRF